jgi:hypothetical protein
MSLVFGGEIGKTDSYTLYAGSLDGTPARWTTRQPSSRRSPSSALGRPAWANIPPALKIFDRTPP